MSSRQIQIVVGLLIVFAIGIALVMLANNNREKLAIQMEAEKVAALAEAKEGTVNAEAAASDKTVKPSFDVARFEPTGDGVVAGLAKPGASVELLANGEPIASASANEVGEWVIVLKEPLKPGNYDLSLKATTSEAEASLSEEFIAVMIPESSTGDVLVVASRPGQASEILARPQAAVKPEADAVQVASADTTEGAAADSGAEVAEPPENPPADTDTAATSPAEGADVAGSEIAKPNEATGAEARPMVDTAGKPGADGAAGTVAVNGSESVEQPANGGSVDQIAETTETTAGETVVAATPTEAGDVQQTSQDMAAASAEPQADETPVDDSAGTDVETSTGSEAAIVAVETASPEVTAKTDAQQQETQTASATETVPRTNDAADPSIAVANPADNTMMADKPAEPMEDDSGASVETDVAATAPAADAPVKEMQVAKTENIVGPLPEEQSSMEKPRPVVPLVLDAVETEGDMVYAAGTGNSGTTVRVYVDDSYIGETVTGDDGRWLLETPASIAAGNVIVRADELETGNAEVVRRAEVPFVKQADAVALLPTSATGGGGASGTSSAEAVAGPKSIIIRSGDNLWTISRRTYGRGIRYTTIYNANDDQIRNPHMIFPGQVFVLPEGDRSWTQ